MRVSTVWLAWVPPGQGCGALAPSTHRKPGVHGWQAVLPDVDVNFPLVHRSHDCVPAAALNEPGRQGLGVAEPTEQLVPAGQTMHSLMEPR